MSQPDEPSTLKKPPEPATTFIVTPSAILPISVVSLKGEKKKSKKSKSSRSKSPGEKKKSSKKKSGSKKRSNSKVSTETTTTTTTTTTTQVVQPVPPSTPALSETISVSHVTSKPRDMSPTELIIEPKASDLTKFRRHDSKRRYSRSRSRNRRSRSRSRSKRFKGKTGSSYYGGGAGSGSYKSYSRYGQHLRVYSNKSRFHYDHNSKHEGQSRRSRSYTRSRSRSSRSNYSRSRSSSYSRSRSHSTNSMRSPSKQRYQSSEVQGGNRRRSTSRDRSPSQTTTSNRYYDRNKSYYYANNNSSGNNYHNQRNVYYNRNYIGKDGNNSMVNTNSSNVQTNGGQTQASSSDQTNNEVNGDINGTMPFANRFHRSNRFGNYPNNHYNANFNHYNGRPFFNNYNQNINRYNMIRPPFFNRPFGYHGHNNGNYHEHHHTSNGPIIGSNLFQPGATGAVHEMGNGKTPNKSATHNSAGENGQIEVQMSSQLEDFDKFSSSSDSEGSKNLTNYSLLAFADFKVSSEASETNSFSLLFNNRNKTRSKELLLKLLGADNNDLKQEGLHTNMHLTQWDLLEEMSKLSTESYDDHNKKDLFSMFNFVYGNRVNTPRQSNIYSKRNQTLTNAYKELCHRENCEIYSNLINKDKQSTYRSNSNKTLLNNCLNLLKCENLLEF